MATEAESCGRNTEGPPPDYDAIMGALPPLVPDMLIRSSAVLSSSSSDEGTPKSTIVGFGGSEPHQLPIIPKPPGAPKRVDIQVIRALAVIAVTLYHLGFPWYQGGFIGVDVFFVVSGYLVFGSLIQEMLKNRFSLSEFLCRRMKRLSMPSAVTLVALTSFLLLSAPFRSIASNCFSDIQAASLHYANWNYLQGSVAYFGDSGAESLVLHFWSLALEEQLYIAIPLLLVLYRLAIPSRWFEKGLAPYISLLSIASFSLIFIQSQPWKFFFPASRVWEFAAGALISYYDSNKKSTVHGGKDPESGMDIAPSRWLSRIPWRNVYAYCFCLIALIILGSITGNTTYPNLITLGIVILTSYVIWCHYDYNFYFGELIGNMSYSIYLYHYPLIQLTKMYKMMYGLPVPIWLPSMAITAILSAASYNFIEKPIQTHRWNKKVIVLVFLLGTLTPALMCIYGNNLPDPYKHVDIPDSKSIATGIPWHINNTVVRTPELAIATKNAAWSFYDAQVYEKPWHTINRRSNTTALVLIGDSLSMQWWISLDHYASELGYTSILASKSNDAAEKYTWYGVERIPREIPDVLREFHNVGIVMIGLSTADMTMESFNQTVTFWANFAPVVIIETNVVWPFSSKMCIRTYEDLTLCRIKDINPKKDSEFYHELVTGGTLNPKRVGMFSMNDISCWNGTCHPNGFDIPLHRDVYHWSSQVVQMPLLWKIFSQRLAANAPFSFLKK